MSYIDANGYRRGYDASHPRANSKGEVYEHIQVAERALGRYLPDHAEVHHRDGNPSNNHPSNLVICQDKAYHKLLHARERIVKAGGNPNHERLCGRCGEVKAVSMFNKRNSAALGTQAFCRECQKAVV